MTRNHKHDSFLPAILLGFVVLAVVWAGVFMLIQAIPGFIPQIEAKLGGTLLDSDRLFLVSAFLATICATLIGYIVYLLRASRVRAGKIASNMIKDVSLSREQFQQLYEMAPVPYLTLSPEGVIIDPNKAMLRLFGMTEKELQEKDFVSLFHPESQDHLEELLERFRRHVPFEGEEVQIVRSDGGVRWIMLSVFRMRNAGMTTHSGLVSCVDITEQKNLDQAKTEFVSLASHQLRTPLTTVKWYTGMLLNEKTGTLSDKQQEYLEKLQQGNESMIDLVDLLLNVSRIEMGTLQTDMQPVDVTSLADDVLRELTPHIKEKTLSIEKHYDHSMHEVETDKRLMRIILQNLLSNAVKYTPEKGTVTVTLEKQYGKLHISVADTGYGIPLDQQDKIFSKMFRADNVRKLSVEGNGLGLYLVKSIIEDVLKGDIGFVSKPSNGTTFTVVLPQV